MRESFPDIPDAFIYNVFTFLKILTFEIINYKIIRNIISICSSI